MKLFRIILRLARRVLLSVLLVYWAIFIGNSAVRLVTGGPSRVAVWYQQTFRAPIISGECKGDTFTFFFPHWGWGLFWTRQCVLLAITLLMCFIEWRSLRNRGQR